MQIEIIDKQDIVTDHKLIKKEQESGRVIKTLLLLNKLGLSDYAIGNILKIHTSNVYYWKSKRSVPSKLSILSLKHLTYITHNEYTINGGKKVDKKRVLQAYQSTITSKVHDVLKK